MRPDQPIGAKDSAAAATPADPVVIRLVAAQRVHGMYPRNNPNVRVALGKLRDLLALFPPGEGLQLEIEREHLKFGDVVVLPNQHDVRDFANKLYLAHISALSVDPEVSDDELMALFDILRLKDDERAALGPLDEILPARGVQHIFVREAGKLKIVEAEAQDPDSWDITSMAELEGLEKKIFGQLGRTGFKEVLRSVAGGQNLRASRLVAMLERPAEFAQYMVEIASRLRPKDKIDLNSQASFLEALLAKMEPVIDRMPESDQIRLYLKLDEVTASLAVGFHKGMLQATAPPFVRVGDLAALFPDSVRDLDVAETLTYTHGPGNGMAPVLIASLRRVAAGDSELAAFMNQWMIAPAQVDLAALAAYRAATLPSGSSDAPPLPLPPDFLLPTSSGPAAAAFAALGRAAVCANGALDSIETVIDLVAFEQDPETYRTLVDSLVDRLVMAFEAHNVRAAATVLDALHAERKAKSGNPALETAIQGALGRCGENEVMRVYTALLAFTAPGSEEIRNAANLVNGLGQNAIVSLIDILSIETVQSTRRKLLEVLVQAGRGHLPLIASYGTHPQWYVVRNVVWILGRLGPNATAPILKVAQHREPRVRREAVRSLALIATPDSVRAVLGYLQDKDESVVREAISKLVSLKAPAATAAINTLAQSPRFLEFDGETMSMIARSLAAAGDGDSVDILEHLAELKASKGWLRAPEVRALLAASAASLKSRLASAREA